MMSLNIDSVRWAYVRDEEKISMLKERYGFNQTSELIRFLLTSTIEEIHKESRLTPIARPQ
jgi:hypothetical protein